MQPVTAPTAPIKTHLAHPSKRGLAARFVRWLTTANKLTEVLTDVMGMTGQAIIRAGIGSQANGQLHVLAVVSQRTNLAARPRFDGWAR